MADKIRLLIAIPNFYGGTGAFCRNLIKALKCYFKDRYYIGVLTFNTHGIRLNDGDLFDNFYTANLVAHTDIRRCYEFLLLFKSLANYIKTFSPHIIFSIGTYMNTLMSLRGDDRYTLILSEHDVPSVRLKYSKYGELIKIFIKKFYKNRLVICASNGVADDLYVNFNVKNLRTIYYGIDISEITDLANKPIETELMHNNYIIAVGRITVQKDYPLLINAFYFAIKAGIKENLIILGEGEERGRIENLIRNYNITDRVKLLGHKDNPYPYIKNAKLFVLSSKWEGFGYVLLEALSLGIPVISTDCPSGPSEILDNGKYGFLIKPGDVNALAAAIIMLLSNNKIWEDMRNKAINRAEAFSLKKMAYEYNNVFEGVTIAK